MKWLTLERIKQQCRIEPDFNDEDKLLELFGDSAEDAVMNLLGRSYEDLYEEYGCTPVPVIHASLLLVASAYKDREKDLVQQTHDNKTFELMLKPYMRLTSPSTNGQNQNQYGCKNL